MSTVLPTIGTSVTPATPWPADTDLMFAVGETKLRIALQRPLIRDIIKDAFKNMRAYLMFNNAFPGVTLALTFARDSLIAAAEGHQPDAAILSRRFQQDQAYFAKLISLVCPIISKTQKRQTKTTDSHRHGLAGFVVTLRIVVTLTV